MCVYTHIHTLSITDILTCNIVASMISGNPATLPHYITLPANVFPQTIPLQEIKKNPLPIYFFYLSCPRQKNPDDLGKVS